MKHVNIPILLLTVLFSGCAKDHCTQPTLRNIFINETRALFSDSVALVVTLENGSNFSKGIDSVYVPFTTSPSGEPYRAKFTYEFQTGQDYIFIFLPSGESHKLSGIRYGNEKYQNGFAERGRETRFCSWGYEMDGQSHSYDAKTDHVDLIMIK